MHAGTLKGYHVPPRSGEAAGSHQRPPLGSVESYLTYPDVRNSDDLYRPTGVRPAIVIAAAKAGKHVLSEKPIAPTAVEAALMLQACRDANVVFMDGVMFMHNPRLSAIKEKTESEDFGDLKRVVGDFSFAGDAGFFKDNIRVNKKLEVRKHSQRFSLSLSLSPSHTHMFL